MKETFIDSEQKIITSCPDCGNQHRLYLIKCNNLIEDDLIVQYCENCQKPYVVKIECKLSCKIKTWRCNE